MIDIGNIHHKDLNYFLIVAIFCDFLRGGMDSLVHSILSKGLFSRL